jgi:hypothetical protein
VIAQVKSASRLSLAIEQATDEGERRQTSQSPFLHVLFLRIWGCCSLGYRYLCVPLALSSSIKVGATMARQLLSIEMPLCTVNIFFSAKMRGSAH